MPLNCNYNFTIGDDTSNESIIREGTCKDFTLGRGFEDFSSLSENQLSLSDIRLFGTFDILQIMDIGILRPCPDQ